MNYNLTLEEREELAREMIEPLLNERYDVEIRFVDAGAAMDYPAPGTQAREALTQVRRSNSCGTCPTAGEVAASIGVNANAVAAYLWRMKMGGLLERQRWSTSDEYKYRITDEGIDVLEAEDGA
jgi:hypothetical protein